MYKKPMQLQARLALVLLILGLFPGFLAAGEWITFQDGRVMRVQKVTVDPVTAPLVTLELESGGALLVPAGSILERVYSPDPEPEPEQTPSKKQTLWRPTAGEYADLIDEISKTTGVDAALLAAVGHVESRFDAYAVSHAGACGLLQLMPATAERFGVEDVFDPADNALGGAKYLRWLIDRFEGDLELALAGYNAGEGAVDRYDGIPPYRETQHYVKAVLAHYEKTKG